MYADGRIIKILLYVQIKQYITESIGLTKPPKVGTIPTLTPNQS